MASSSAFFTIPVRSKDSSQCPQLPSAILHAPPRTVGWRWLNVGSAGVAGLALVYNSLLPTPPLQKAQPKVKSEGVSAALCSTEFAAHAWTAFNLGWSATLSS